MVFERMALALKLPTAELEVAVAGKAQVGRDFAEVHYRGFEAVIG